MCMSRIRVLLLSLFCRCGIALTAALFALFVLGYGAFVALFTVAQWAIPAGEFTLRVLVAAVE